MKKVFLFAFVALFSLSACVPDFLNQGAPSEAVDIDATVDAAASTQAVQTVAALVTPTMEDAAELELEASPTVTVTATVTETPPPTETSTPTETPDGTEESMTGTPGTPTKTSTPDGTTTPATATVTVTETSAIPSPTSPISVNEPPDYIPRYKIKVRNNTKVRVYISLQGSTEGGYHPIVEYDLAPWQRVKLTVPEGYYAVIVYVGKDPMIEYVGIHSNNTVEIEIRKEDIKIAK